MSQLRQETGDREVLMSEPRLIATEMPDLLPMQNRSPGMHVSTIITDLCRKAGIFKKGGDTKLSTVWAQLGCALEWAIIERYEEHFPGRYLQPGEQELDGIFGTPDLFDMEDWALVEIKLAWISSRHDPVPDTCPACNGPCQKLWRYWVQLKAYCRMMETTTARLMVCFVMGEYKGGGPVWREWEWEFTRQELEENWKMLKTHGERLEGE